MKSTKNVSESLLVGQGALVRVYVNGGTNYWSSGGLIGIDHPSEDVVLWHRVAAGRLVFVKSAPVTREMQALMQAVIAAGLYEAGIIDVPPKR